MERCTRIVVPVLLALLAGAGPGWAQPDLRYPRIDQITAQFEAWESAYPSILRREVIGYSLVGEEPLLAAKISDHPGSREAEPVLFFHGAQHANEPNGTTAAMYLMRRLLEGYGVDARITSMVDSLEIWFLPIVNPDGHRLAFGASPDWETWRKTARDNNGDGRTDFPVDGVDTNRNWDWRWAEYDSTEFGSLSYKGPYPFSEPEVAAVRDFILRENPLIVMDYHSPVMESPGNVVWWPWLRTSGHYSPDEPVFRPLSVALGLRTQTEVDTLYYSGYGAALDRLPKEQNWVYAHTGACILLMEISRRNWWDGVMVDTVAARVGRGSFYLLERALAGPGIKGIVTEAQTGEPLAAEIRVLEAHDDSVGPRLAEPRLGAYWRLLNPGVYSVHVICPGYIPLYRTEVVGSNGWTERNYALQRLTPAGVAASFTDRRGGAVRAPELLLRNPARPGERIVLAQASEEGTWVRLFDPTGRLLRDWNCGNHAGGTVPTELPSDLPAGVYLVQFDTRSGSVVRKITVVR